MNFISFLNKILSDYSDIRISNLMGIERTRINRIKNGKAKIKFEELKRLADLLNLPKEQRKKLFDLYIIDKYGIERFNSRKITKEFLMDIYYNNNNNHSIGVDTISYNVKLSFPQDTIVVDGSISISSAISLVMDDALSNNSPIRIISSSNDKFLFSQLFGILSKSNSMEIDHIVLAKYLSEEVMLRTNNIDVAKSVYSLFQLGGNYCAYYLNEDTGTCALMPFYIITDRYSVNISNNLTSAIITQDKAIIALHNRLFINKKVESHKLIENINTPENYLRRYVDILLAFNLSSKGNRYCSIDYEPCILSFLTPDFLSGVLCSDLASDELRSLFQKFIEYYMTFGNHRNQISYFTKEGLNAFVNTGKISEVPDIFNIAVDYELRKKVLYELVDYIKSDRNNSEFRLINDANFNIPSNMRFFGNGSRLDHLFFISDNTNCIQSIFNLSQIGITDSVYDFTLSLIETDMVYSKEETCDYIEKVLENM